MTLGSELDSAPSTTDSARWPRTARELAAAIAAVIRNLLARPLASYYLLVSSTALLLIIGLAMVYSATSVEQFAAKGSTLVSIEKQSVLAGIGVVGFWLCQRLPVRTYRALARPLLIVAFVLLIALDVLAVLAQAKVLHDPKFGLVRADELWLYIGPLQVQPSEFAKIALAIWVADVLVRKGERAGAWRDLSRPLFPVAGLLFVLVGYNDLESSACERLQTFGIPLGITIVDIEGLPSDVSEFTHAGD